jgi:hypothetical protein
MNAQSEKLSYLTESVAKLANSVDALRANFSKDLKSLQKDLLDTIGKTIRDQNDTIRKTIHYQMSNLSDKLAQLCKPPSNATTAAQCGDSAFDSTPPAVECELPEDAKCVENYSTYDDSCSVAASEPLNDAQSVEIKNSSELIATDIHDCYDSPYDEDEYLSTFPFVLINGLKTKRLNSLSATIIGPQEGTRVPVLISTTKEQVKIKCENLFKYIYNENSIDTCPRCQSMINLCAFPACDCHPADDGKVLDNRSLSATRGASSSTSSSSVVNANSPRVDATMNATVRPGLS